MKGLPQGGGEARIPPTTLRLRPNRFRLPGEPLLERPQDESPAVVSGSTSSPAEAGSEAHHVQNQREMHVYVYMIYYQYIKGQKNNVRCICIRYTVNIKSANPAPPGQTSSPGSDADLMQPCSVNNTCMIKN